MTDPSEALTSFQLALKAGSLELQRCSLAPQVFVHLDHPDGKPRFTYASVESSIVTALAIFVATESIAGKPCFQVGYAAPKAYRNQGRTRKLVAAAIAEMRLGFSRTPMKSFFIEAIVGIDNIPSQHVAKAAITESCEDVVDGASGLPAVRFLREFHVQQ